MSRRDYSATEAGQRLGIGPGQIIQGIKRGEILSRPLRSGRINRYRIPGYEVDRLIDHDPVVSKEGPEIRRLRREVEDLQAEIRRLNSIGSSGPPDRIKEEGDGLTEYTGLASFPPAVYFLFSGEELVYIGQSVSLSARIATHRMDRHKVFDRAYYIHVERARLNQEENRLIQKYRPRLNSLGPFKRIGEPHG